LCVQEATEATKKAEAREEELLYQKLEKDRQEMQKTYEEEQKLKKVS